MSNGVLTVAEGKDGRLRQVSFEVLTAARRIAGDGEMATVVLGGDAGKYVEELGEYGADKVYAVTHDNRVEAQAERYAQALHQVVNQLQPRAILMPHTAIGKELAPRLAARLQLGLVSDVTDVEVVDGDVIFTRPIYAGKAFEKRRMAGGIPFATIRPNNIAAQKTGGPAAALVEVTAEIKDLRAVVKDVVRKTTGKVDLAEAKIVVAGGRGLKSADGFQPLQELADLLGGAVGASRGACDAGYCDYALQIGQTGKVITPDLYIAAGISGAIQHLAGMSGSRIVVAINKDPEAPIFKAADYGIVGDLFQVVPLLIEEFKAAMQR
jgi:electron transfer flavoprotein alpha subunit